jgi:type I restriction enzyme S subunit
MDLLQKHFDTALESPDGIKKLRELILTLAMQGKLVKQDPKDQPASELLKEIQAEKERLVKSGEFKKQNPVSSIKIEMIPYKTPISWQWIRLAEICTQITDGTHLTPSYIDSGIPFLSVKNLSSGVIDFSDTKFVSVSEHIELSKRCKPEMNDILLTKIGTTGIAVRVNTDKEFSIFVSVALIKFINTKVYPQFLEMLINSPLVKKYSKDGTEGVGNKNLVLRKIREYLIPLPPLAEQKSIVAKIDELMALCDRLEAQRNARNDKRLASHTAAINRLLTAADTNDFDSAWQLITCHFDPLYSVIENVAELKKAILTLAMQGKLVKQDPKDQPASELRKEIQAEKERLIKEGKIKKQKELLPIKQEEVLYEVPDGWEWVRFGEIAQHNSGKTLDSGRNRGVPRDYITTSNLYWGRFVLDNVRQMLIQDEELEKCTAKHGDLLICEGGEAGRAAVWMLDYDVCFQNHVHRARFFMDVEPFFSYRFFEKINATGEINQYRKGVGISNMSSKALSSILFPLPPLAEQKRIVAKIDELMELCNKLEKQIDQATEKRTALFDAVLAKV